MEKQEEFDQFYEIIAPSKKQNVQNYLFSVKLKSNRVVNPILIELYVRGKIDKRTTAQKKKRNGISRKLTLL